jgi:hypothetical protein
MAVAKPCRSPMPTTCRLSATDGVNYLFWSIYVQTCWQLTVLVLHKTWPFFLCSQSQQVHAQSFGHVLTGRLLRGYYGI